MSLKPTEFPENKNHKQHLAVEDTTYQKWNSVKLISSMCTNPIPVAIKLQMLSSSLKSRFKNKLKSFYWLFFPRSIV